MNNSPISFIAVLALSAPLCNGLISTPHPRNLGPQATQARVVTREKQGEQPKQDAPPKEQPIAGIEFEGNVTFSTQELTAVLEDCLKGDSSTQLMYREPLFEYCVRFTLTNHMRSKGYLKSRIREPEKHETIEGLKLTLRVEEGGRYRIGNVRIDGSKVFTHEQIAEMLETKSGDVADGSRLFKGLEARLKEEYSDRGYLQYDYDVEPTFGEFLDSSGDGIVDFVITITEGTKFKVHSIQFVGNITANEFLLRQELPLKEGEPFSRKLFAESIEKLNGLGLFEPIDERHVDFATDQEMGRLALKFKVKEKQPF